jgi:S-adenosylmethionine decarboxylase
VLAEFAGCDRTLLNNLAAIETILKEAARQADATIVDSVFHHYNPHGLSGVVVIAESHLSIHTWPEYGYAAVDVFTCGDRVKPEDAVKLITERLEAHNCSMIELRRGIVEDSQVRCATK